MRFTGQNTLHAPVDVVWEALLDPAVLVRTIPGCDRLEALPSTGDDHAYAMTVTAGVAAIKGTYTGSCELVDLVAHESLTMRLQGAGAPGTVAATVGVRFTPSAEGTTVDYEADAVVGGMVGGVGQRMLTSVSKRMAGEFFGNVDEVLEGGVAGTGVFVAPAEPGMPATYVDVRGAGGSPSREFLAGLAVGAGLVVLGVLVGRRR